MERHRHALFFGKGFTFQLYNYNRSYQNANHLFLGLRSLDGIKTYNQLVNAT